MRYCEHCGIELLEYEDDFVGGKPVCRSCAEEIAGDDIVIDFIKAYPGEFLEYLRMTLGSDQGQVVIPFLQDYRNWNTSLFERWAVS